MTTFAGTYLVTEKLKSVLDAEVDAAEAVFGTTFPLGYREYVTTLGSGEYCDYIYVSQPQMLTQNMTAPKRPLEEFCHSWDGKELGLTPERLAESIVFANSIDGDWVIFHPTAPSDIYILPRSEEIVHRVGAELSDAFTWLYEPQGNHRFRYFNSGIDQKHLLIPRKLNLSYEEFRDWLLGLHRHDFAEEISRPNEASSNMTYALLSGGQIQVAQPDEEKHFMAFFKSFFGCVLCYTDLFGRLNLQVTHDPTQEDDTVTRIAEFLQSKAR